MAAPRRQSPIAAAALVLAGCGASQLDVPSIEKTIRTLAASKLGTPIRSVTCPGSVKLQQGLVTVCRVRLRSGEVEPFTITQKDSSGNVDIRPRDLLAGSLEKTIVDRLAARGLKATATCPRHVVIRVGASVVCTATGPQGERLRVRATILDATGSYRLSAA